MNGLLDLIKTLKERLNDSNKTLVIKYIYINIFIN